MYENYWLKHICMDHVCWQENSNIISNIEPPTPVSQKVFGLCREDLEKVKGLIQYFFVDICYVVFCSKVFKHIRLMLIVNNITI